MNLALKVMSRERHVIPSNFSIVISTCRREKYVNQLLNSIKSQSLLPQEIILVDSSESRIVYKIPECLNVKLVKSDIAQLTYQRNLGVANSNWEIILHIDDDVILEDDYIKNIIETFNKDENNEIDVVGGYISNEWDKLDYKPSILLRLFKFFNLYDVDLLPGKISSSGIFIELQGLDKNIGLYETDFISGTSFAVRSRVYKKYKHPENINKYGGEDKVFSRIISKKFKMVINTKARLRHLFAQSGNRDNDYVSYKNTVRFLLYIHKEVTNNSSSTLILRFYYQLSAMEIIFTGISSFILKGDFKKNIARLKKGCGYFSGSLSLN